MKRLLFKLLFTLGLVLFPLFGFSQAEIPAGKGEDIKFEKISTEQELSTQYTTCILQDRFGFMWTGTEEVLN